MSDRESAKQRMVNAAIELICEGKTPSGITVADITEKAGVGNGMVNYHFQSKDNLMRTAVKGVMGCAKEELDEKLSVFWHLPAQERLAAILKEVMDLFAQNAEICKIAILENLENDDGVPHLLSDVEAFNSCLKELYHNDMRRIWIKNYIIASFLNYVFLKAAVIKRDTSFDFYNKTHRDQTVDTFLTELFHRGEAECFSCGE